MLTKLAEETSAIVDAERRNSEERTRNRRRIEIFDEEERREDGVFKEGESNGKCKEKYGFDLEIRKKNRKRKLK